MKEIWPTHIWKKDSYFIDTNILFYAVGKNSNYKKQCLKILKHISSNEIGGVTNCEVLQEIIHRYWRLNQVKSGIDRINKFLHTGIAVFPITLNDLSKSMQLIKNNSNITSRDAIHAATMLNNGIKKIITADRHFDRIRNLKRIDPREF